MKKRLLKLNRVAALAFAAVMAFGFAAYTGIFALAAETPVAEGTVEVDNWDDLARALIDGQNVILGADIVAKSSDDPLGSAYLGAGYGSDEYGDIEVADPNATAENPDATYNRHYVVVGAKAASGNAEVVLDLNGHTLTLNQTYFVVDQHKTFTINGGGSDAQGSVSYKGDDGEEVYAPSYGSIAGAHYTAVELGGNDSALNLNGVIFTGNGQRERTYGGAVVGGAFSGNENFASEGTIELNVNDCYFVGNGSAVRFFRMDDDEHIDRHYTGVLNIKDSVFSGSNFRGLGGAIYAEKTDITVGNSLFANNTVIGDGAAIYLTSGTLTVTDTDFVNNHADYKGGAVVLMDSATMTMNGSSSMYDNTSMDGGAVYVRGYSSLTMNDRSVMSANTVSGGGGGAVKLVDHSAITMNGSSSMYSNTATYSGGAIDIGYVSENGYVNKDLGYCVITLNDDVTLYNNSVSANGGGAIAMGYTGGSTLLINDNVSIHDNTAVDGGAINAMSYYTGGTKVYEPQTIIIRGNVKINNNTARASGGAFNVMNASVDIDGAELCNNTASSTGGVISGNYFDAITIKNSKLNNNRTGSSGGALHMYEMDGNLIIENSELCNNSAGVGGALSLPNYMTGEKVEVKNTKINGNTAGQGAALFVYYALNTTFTFDGCEINDNAGTGNGGAIFVYDTGDFYFTDTKINNNSGQLQGGAIFWQYPGSLYMDGCEMCGNTAQGYGGALFVYGYNMTFRFDRSKIDNNTSRSWGGAIWIYDSSGTLNMDDTSLCGNTSYGWGGALLNCYGDTYLNDVVVENNSSIGGRGGAFSFICGGSVTISGNSSISENTVTSTLGDDMGSGGAIYACTGWNVTLDGIRVENNTADNMGGGIFVSNGSLTLKGASVINNTAGADPEQAQAIGITRFGEGGGVYAANTRLSISDNTVISGNTAQGYYREEGANATGGIGGGIRMSGVTIELFENVTITENKADSDGGGLMIYSIYNPALLENVTIEDNYSGSNGGGILVDETVDFTISGSSISNNYALGYGGGIAMNNGGSLTIDDTVVEGNKSNADGGGVLMFDNSTLTISGGSSIKGNEALFSGGGIYMGITPEILGPYSPGASVLTVTDSSIKDNVASNGVGGGVYSVGVERKYPTCGNNIITLDNAQISGNKAEAYLANGGGIYATYTDITAANGSVISGNYAEGSGGGVYMDLNVNLTMEDTTVEGNTAAYSGGGIASVTRTEAIIPELGETYDEAAAAAEGDEANNVLVITDSAVKNNTASGTTWANPESPVELGNGGGIYLSEGTTLTVSGSTVSGNSAARNGGGICAVNISDERNLLTITTTTISGNTAGRADGSKVDDNRPEVQREYGNGGGLYLEGVALTIGDGMIISGNTALAEGGGIYATRHFVDGAGTDSELGGWYAHPVDYYVESAIIMNGGKISGNLAKGQGVRVLENPDNDWGYGGGAICVKSSELTINGGEISDNGALTSGGGLLLSSRNGWDSNSDKTPYSTLTMTGGTISGNVAEKREGGGISLINASAVITGGSILGNKTGYMADDPDTPNTAYGDWGGGGIFVGERATLKIPTTVLVTENKAGGFGGGVADCSTGFIFTYNGKDSGAAIFGNRAENDIPNLTGEGTTKPEDHIAAEDKIFLENGYHDYYGENFTYIRNWMFNGALENWKGSADGVAVTMQNNDELIAFERVGLTAYPEGNLPETADVIISGNVSYTHGGGIMSNGFSFLGEEDEEVIEVERGAKLELLATKQFVTPDGKPVDLSGYEFKFEVRNARTDEVVAIGTSDADGNITFDNLLVFDSTNCPDEETTFTFIVTEIDTDISEVKSDPARYQLTVTVKYSEEPLLGVLSDDSILPGNENDLAELERILVHQYEITEVTVEKWDADTGNWVAVEDALAEQDYDKSNTTRLTLTQDGATFTNMRKTGSLTVSKTVEGKDGNLNKKFTFTVTLSDKTINGTYGDMTFVNGVAVITLKHGESATAVGLPTGITYTVVETADDEYTTESTGETGTIEDGVTAKADFVNTKIPEPTEPKPSTPKTGDDTNLFLYTALMLLSGCGLGIIMMACLKRKRGMM